MMNPAVCVETNQSERVFDLQAQTLDPNTKRREDVCHSEVSPLILDLSAFQPLYLLTFTPVV